MALNWHYMTLGQEVWGLWAKFAPTRSASGLALNTAIGVLAAALVTGILPDAFGLPVNVSTLNPHRRAITLPTPNRRRSSVGIDGDWHTQSRPPKEA
ncbi:MAG: hypothetical protein ACRD0K_12915 [Egibacteraceae bacterium]